MLCSVELRSVLHQFNLLLSAMVHFISQLQYYITFEVLLQYMDVIEYASVCACTHSDAHTKVYGSVSVCLPVCLF